MHNRTTLIVAHRLATVRNADTIAVLQHGELVEAGSHTELLKAPSGIYSQFVRLQSGISSNGPSRVTSSADLAGAATDSSAD